MLETGQNNSSRIIFLGNSDTKISLERTSVLLLPFSTRLCTLEFSRKKDLNPDGGSKLHLCWLYLSIPVTSTTPGGNTESVAALTATCATALTLTGGVSHGPTSGTWVSGLAYCRTCTTNQRCCKVSTLEKVRNYVYAFSRN